MKLSHCAVPLSQGLGHFLGQYFSCKSLILLRPWVYGWDTGTAMTAACAMLSGLMQLENFSRSFKVPLVPFKRNWQSRAWQWFFSVPVLRLLQLASRIALWYVQNCPEPRA